MDVRIQMFAFVRWVGFHPLSKKWIHKSNTKLFLAIIWVRMPYLESNPDILCYLFIVKAPQP
jgi:hypothetical protein